MGTKLITIELAALTRVCHSVIVEVPDDLDLTEQDRIVDQAYETTSGAEFTDDTDYWEKGACYASEQVPENAKPVFRAWKDDDTKTGWRLAPLEAPSAGGSDEPT